MRIDRVAAVLAAVACIFAPSPDLNAGAEAPDRYCRLFAKVRDNFAINVGRQVDPLTRFDGIEVVCDRKAVVFRQNVRLYSDELGKDWIMRRQRHWSQTYCKRHRAFADAMRAGWTISTILSLADGQTLRLDAACHDAEA